MERAILEHYAAFIESQTGVPAADTIKSIMAKAKEYQKEESKQVKKWTIEFFTKQIESINYAN